MEFNVTDLTVNAKNVMKYAICFAYSFLGLVLKRKRLAGGEGAMEEEDEKPSEPCLTYRTHHGSFTARQCTNRGKRMSARALLYASERTLWGFVMEAPQDLSCDDYAASVMHSLNVVHPYDVIFVQQVLYGCCRYTKLLNILITNLFKCKAAYTHPEDEFLYTVLGYLIMIRLQELTFPNLRRLVMSQFAQKLLPFVQYVFDEDALNLHCKPQWLTVYDNQFVEELIHSISAWSREAAELESSLGEKVFIKDLRDGRRTIPQPFNLSTSRVPEETEADEDEQVHLPHSFRAKSAPKFRSVPTPRQRRVEACHLENKKKQQLFYAHPNHQPFRLRSLERPTNIEQVRSEVELRRKMENEYIPIKPSRVPEPSTKEVKLNTAAVLREHAFYQRQIEAEKKRVDAFESELRSDASFRAWQNEVRARVDMGEALQAQFRRETVVAIGQAITEAKLANVREKQVMANDVRQEEFKMNTQREEFYVNLELANKLKRESVALERVAVKEAICKVAETKKGKAQEIQGLSNEITAELATTRAIELKMKQELVRQLRALEKETVHIQKRFDPNTTAGHMLLEEMSLAELRERLVLVQQAIHRQREYRRALITTSKQEKRNALLEKSLFVKKMRQVVQIEQTSKREMKSKYRISSTLSNGDDATTNFLLAGAVMS